MSRYRALLTALPQHSRVLPIYTAHKQGGVAPFLHAGAYIVIDRAGFIPYLFSADRGDPMMYFRYLQRPYAPHEEWYRRQDPTFTPSDPSGAPPDQDVESVDWTQVASDYQYLIISKPFDRSRILVGGRTVAENEVAAVLSIP